TAAGEPVYTYLCTSKEHNRSQVCNMKNANGNVLDAKVMDMVTGLGKNSEDMARRITRAKKQISSRREGCDAEAAKVREQVTDNETQIKALVLSLGKTTGSHAEKYIMEQIDELHEKGQSLQNRLKELDAMTRQHELADMEFDMLR